MKRIKTFLFIVSMSIMTTIIMSFQHSPETQKYIENAPIDSTNIQTKGISSCIYAGGYCWANGKFYKGITATKP